MVTAPAVTLPGSEVHVLHSDAVGDDFEISVFEPLLGAEGPLATVYATDGNQLVGLAGTVIRMLQAGAEIPPVRLICVGYPIGDNRAEFLRLRTRDFAPTNDAARSSWAAETTGLDVRGGGADAFMEFLTAELRPWVESRYDVTDDATLIGNSMGGLFATYVLFTAPTAFTRYVIGSPFLCYDREVSTGYESRYAAEHDDLPATVFLCAGADEEVLSPALPPPYVRTFRGADTAKLTRELGESLGGRGYPSLKIATRIFPGETHATTPPILFAHGLRCVFEAERLAG